MWHVNRLSFENYRTFHRSEQIELRPLTVLIGRNSAGKSAISRLPLLLGRGLSADAEAPLELAFDGHDFGGSFLDLVCNRVPTRSIRLGVQVGDGARTIELQAEVGFWSELRLQAIRSFRLVDDGAVLIDLVWNQQGDPDDQGLRYEDRTEPKRPEPVAAQFTGLLPRSIAGHPETRSRVLAVYAVLREALGGLMYLGPFRDAPLREMRLPEGNVRDVGLRGGNAARALASDSLRQGARVLGRVGEWYREHLGGWQLDLEREGQSFSVVLRPPADPTVAINLRDAGVGLSQVLPVVVQHELDRVTGRVSGLDIVEQPELHLHPGVHGDLADLYIEAARRRSARFLIETHSENFVLRVRRRIAEAVLSPEDVALYWVNDDASALPRVKPIHIDAMGGIDFWPRGVFAEDLDEVRAIRVAQQERVS